MIDDFNKIFVEIDHYSLPKYNQSICGDVFYSKKSDSDRRIVSVLADGLGSGIKANLLATLTSTMAAKFILDFKDPKVAAETIIKTLPVCKERKISYSSFAIVDVDSTGLCRAIEYENPEIFVIREGKEITINKKRIPIKSRYRKNSFLNYSEFYCELGDRIVFFTDGITQAGIGSKQYPLGWGKDNAVQYMLKIIEENSSISARELSRKITQKANALNQYIPKDDTTCAVVYYRLPRKLLVLTGPPLSKDKDKEFAALATNFQGRKVICGGTTAKIIARELDRNLRVNLKDVFEDVAPISEMNGIDLITEGAITLSKALDCLNGEYFENRKNHPVKLLTNILLESDIIEFAVGSKINEAHQEPNMPIELGFRRLLIKKIARALAEKYLKKVSIKYF